MGKGGFCGCCTTAVVIGFLIFLSIVLIALGAGSIPFLAKFYRKTVENNLVLEYDNSKSKGNEAYTAWSSPPAPVYMQFYMFNYTNPEEYMAGKSKPNVTQLGPYSYREVRENVILYRDENEITYLQNYSYVFDPATSCANCSQDDVITTPNLPVLTVLTKLKALNITKNSPFYVRIPFEALNLVLNNDPTYTMFMELPVGKLLWGFDSPFITRLEKLIPDVFKKMIPDLNVDPHIVLQQNGTAGAKATGNLTILTGKQDINDVQLITKWRGIKSTGSMVDGKFTSFWHGKYGNMINGTDGSRFQPYISTSDIIYIFNPQLCRSIYFNYQRDTSLFDISLYRYTTLPEVFQNHTANPNNAAFCGSDNICYGSGLLPVGQCQAGSPPVFMSSPHFYQGYPELWQSINGLKPEESLHETYLSIEPTTGLVMDAHKRLQINVNAPKVELLTRTGNFPKENNFMPVLFVHEYATIDKPNADKFKSEVMAPKKYITIGEYSLIGLGALLLVIAIIVGARHQRKTHKEDVYAKFDNDDAASQDSDGNIQQQNPQVPYPL